MRTLLSYLYRVPYDDFREESLKSAGPLELTQVGPALNQAGSRDTKTLNLKALNLKAQRPYPKP